MIAAQPLSPVQTQSACPIPAWHAGFLKLLPAIRTHARCCFRELATDAREEAIQEVVSLALIAYVRLHEQGREHVAFAVPLARYAVHRVRDGRCAAGGANVRDLTSARCRCHKGVIVERLDNFDERAGTWEALVVEDRRATPADVAITRIDFSSWLACLPRKKRRIAEKLATGETTGAVAQKFRVSAARIAQLRREFHDAWLKFHGEVIEDTDSAAA